MLPGQKNAGDKAVSIGTSEFKKMVDTIRKYEYFNLSKKVTGLNYFKKNLQRSAYANKNLTKGSKLKYTDITFLRPFSINGINFDSIFDNSNIVFLKNNIKKDSLIRSKDLLIKK